MAMLDPLQHAHRIRNAVQRGAPASSNGLVMQSWARCLGQYQLDPSRPRQPPRLGHAELPDRQHRMAAVIDCARYEMTTLYQQLGDPDSAVVLTDTGGVILHLVTSQEFERVMQPLGLDVGTVWSEAEVGTNGMGTCAAEACPIVVQQSDHFFSAYASLTCSAVPIYDPAGEMTAVLDVTSRSKLAQQHLLVLLGMTARMIENRLIDLRFRQARANDGHLPPDTPPNVQRLLRRCLQKDPQLRLRHAGDARLELMDGDLAAVAPPRATAGRQWRPRCRVDRAGRLAR